MKERFERRMYAVFTDGVMSYPVFVEVAKGTPLDVETLRGIVADQFGLGPDELSIASYPRWATRHDAPEGHVVHVGLLPSNDDSD